MLISFEKTQLFHLPFFDGGDIGRWGGWGDIGRWGGWGKVNRVWELYAGHVLMGKIPLPYVIL